MAQNLSIAQRQKLRRYIVSAAAKYERYFCSKSFLIVCDDFSTYEVTFPKGKFKHLTGVRSEFNKGDFWKMASTFRLDANNIDGKQIYSISTLFHKCIKMSNFDKFLFCDTDQTLFLLNLHTHSADFPIAINNPTLNLCVGFINGQASTTRKSANSFNADKVSKILCILSKHVDELKYNTIVYVSGLKELCADPTWIRVYVDIKLKDKLISACDGEEY